MGPYLEPIPAEETPSRSEPAPQSESVPEGGGEGLREKQPTQDVPPPPDEDNQPPEDGPETQEKTVTESESTTDPNEATTEQYQY